MSNSRWRRDGAATAAPFAITIAIAAGGFKVQIHCRAGLGEQALFGATWGTLGQVYGNKNTTIGTPFSTYDINVPQPLANVDRTRAKQMGVQLNDIYDTLQVNLGSLARCSTSNVHARWWPTQRPACRPCKPPRSAAATARPGCWHWRQQHWISGWPVPARCRGCKPPR